MVKEVNAYAMDQIKHRRRLSDIGMALTARDRSFKKAMTLSPVIKILEQMKADNQIYADVFDLSLDQRSHLPYARKEMDPEQIDL